MAAVVLQACVRGFLERKKVAVLRAEMRVFGALQVRGCNTLFNINTVAILCSKFIKYRVARDHRASNSRNWSKDQ